MEQFQAVFKDNYKEHKHEDVIANLLPNTQLSRIYPNMSIIAQICRVIPIHTADVERTFSQLKLIKTRVRNRMNEKTLDSLLRISIEGPPLENFNFSEAVKLWAA